MPKPTKDAPALGRKRGSQPGNRNNLRHGLRGAVMPRDARYIQNRLDGIKRLLEDATIACKGGVSFADACHVQTAQRWERVACLSERYARVNADKLAEKVVDYYERAAKASESRDKAILRIGLDGDHRQHIIDALYTPLPAPQGNSDGPDKTPD